MENIKQKYNLKSPAVKRLMREAAELCEPTEQYCAQPLEENLFEWHFTVRGPPDTEFSEGIYHGRITLPPEYPMKPPSIILLTPNGRFETGKKICLSMSAYHPESWQPSWSIRTVLLALIGFMPSKGAGAIGSLDYSPAERKILAKRSKTWKCETCNMDPSSTLKPVTAEHEKETINEAKELASQIMFKGEAEKSSASTSTNVTITTATTTPNTFPYNSTPLTQEQIQQFQEFYRQLNPLHPQTYQPIENFPPSNPQAVSSTLQQNTQAQTSTSSAQAPSSIPQNSATTTNTVSSETSSNTELRQRQNIIPQVNTANNQSRPSQVTRSTGRSIIDSITLILMWIIAVLLVALILRRLAIENTSLAKS